MDALAAAYDSSAESDGPASSSSPPPPKKKRRRTTQSRSPPIPTHTQKKKRLRPPPPTLVPAAPADDPAQHQGRTRTTPHVDGQFAAHVFVRVALADDVRRAVRAVVRRAEEGVCADVHTCIGMDADGDADGDADTASLHLSLSRGVFLRAHQRAPFLAAVRAAVSVHAPFTASFAAPAVLVNDTRTRAFVALEVGAGHSELHALAASLAPALAALHQEGAAYYARPRFHASVLWTLLKRAGEEEEGGEGEGEGTTPSPTPTPPPTPTPLDALLPMRLAAPAAFRVTHVSVRVGRDVRAFALRGGEGSV